MLKNALASFLLIASVALADYTFQTFPASEQIVLTSQPLTVRWEVRAGFSPESPSQAAPPMLRVHLGSRNGETPKVYWPPLNGEGNNVPLSQGYYQWNWNPNMFNEPLPPRGPKGTGSQFFFQIQDGTGYISSGQPFYIIESAAAPSTAPPSTTQASNAATSTTAAPSESTRTPTATATNTNANPTGNGNDNSPNKPPTGDSPATASTQDSGAGILTPQLAVAAAAVIASAAGSVL